MSKRSEAMKRVQELVTDDPHTVAGTRRGATPWDAGECQPPLREIISSGELQLPNSGRALVPGCGSGYDAVYIASTLGFATLALDISPTAVKKASEEVSASKVDNIRFEQGDFFFLQVTETEKFDLIYDYTFFVAIPPSRRMEWGVQMSKLVKTGGFLITLAYPIEEEEPQVPIGPPWFVRPQHYHDCLGNDRWQKVVDRVPETSSPMHIGRERLLVWRKI
ncbi:S-adenosyl-L-methionine-dependent methyltransferase [Mycena indigotica]|uniref:S-adenosyl-L-methionine-dependent methyltransferase n=1 Tax=Mycena indigotica TaxID=2126181 RepID=A0A8H6VS34_9AGAR|nr:S-adenosyl-L-methionine-dependent methyltransferase [Mycena indigotica]KAF7289966.1 S-adenosyl-L-methionine-dependent methyltransferase [Mycena indigotica]